MNIYIELNKFCSFETLDPFVQNAKEEISFFGYRYIYVDGYKDVLRIDSLAKRVLEILSENFKFEFDENERAFLKKISNKVDLIYKNNDDRIKQKFLITRIICSFRDWLHNFEQWGYGIRFQWDHENESFNYYTESQYFKVFKTNPTTKASLIRDGRPNRWCVRKQQEN